MSQAMKVVVNNNVNPEAEALAKQVEELRAKLKAVEQESKPITFKVEEFKHKKTGETMRGINIHGITARPIFLYGSQALKMTEVAAALQQFVEANRDTLSWKK